jgi:CHAT domain-containing protein/tetratricopeptide (TPR) repeat protein
LSVIELLPGPADDPVRRIREWIGERDEPAVRTWVREHRRSTSEVIRRFIERGLSAANESRGTDDLDMAARVAEIHRVEHADRSLADYVAACRRIAADPDALARRLALDRQIRRDEFADYAILNRIYGRPTLPSDEVAAGFDAAGREYERIGDAWGRIACEVRRLWALPAGREAERREVLRKAGAGSVDAGYRWGEAELAYHAAFRTTEEPLDLARGLYTQAIDALTAAGIEEGLATAKNEFGFDLIKRGCFGEAMEHLRDAVRLFRTLSDSGRRLAMALANLSGANDGLGRFPEAKRLAAEASEILDGLRRTADASELEVLASLHARVLWRESLAAWHLGNPAQALNLARDAEAAAPQGDADSRARALTAAARALLDLGRPSEALASADRAAGLAYDWRTAQALVVGGRAARFLNDFPGAEDRLARALLILRDSVSDLPGAAEAAHELSELHAAGGAGERALETRKAWLSIVNRILGARGLDPRDRAALADSWKSGFESGVTLSRASERPDPSALDLAFGFFEGGRPRTSAELAGAMSESRAETPLATIAAAMPGGTVLVEYLVGSNRSFALALRRDRPPRVIELPGSGPSIRRLADRFQASVASGDRIEDIDARSRAVHDVLIAPIRGELENAVDLIVAPCESLSSVPFEALRSAGGSAGAGYLCERFTISYAPSVSIAYEWLIRRAEEPPPSGILVLADPETRDDLTRLPRAREEVEAIRRSMGDEAVRVFTGIEAGSGRLAEAALERFRVIHFAAHAVVHRGSGYLALAPEQGKSGRLTDEDLRRLPLPRADLVVLSACGPSDEPDGEGRPVVRTLPGAFLARGTRGVISSRWRVDDARTALLMARFYERLARGERPARALNGTRLSLIRSDSAVPGPGLPPSRPVESLSHPRNWSAFAFEGDPR